MTEIVTTLNIEVSAVVGHLDPCVPECMDCNPEMGHE